MRQSLPDPNGRGGIITADTVPLLERLLSPEAKPCVWPYRSFSTAWGIGAIIGLQKRHAVNYFIKFCPQLFK